MRFHVVSQDLKGTILVQDFKQGFVRIQLPVFRFQSDKYIVHHANTANQVNHFQNFIAKMCYLQRCGTLCEFLIKVLKIYLNKSLYFKCTA